MRHILHLFLLLKNKWNGEKASVHINQNEKKLSFLVIFAWKFCGDLAWIPFNKFHCLFFCFAFIYIEVYGSFAVNGMPFIGDHRNVQKISLYDIIVKIDYQNHDDANLFWVFFSYKTSSSTKYFVMQAKLIFQKFFVRWL